MLAGVQPDDGGKNECPSHPKRLKSYGQAIEALKHRPYCEALDKFKYANQQDGSHSFLISEQIGRRSATLRRRSRSRHLSALAPIPTQTATRHSQRGLLLLQVRNCEGETGTS